MLDETLQKVVNIYKSENIVPSKEKILQVCKVYFPIKGGVQIVAERLARQLPNHYSSTILTTAKQGTGVEQTRFGKVIRCKSYFELLSMPFAPSIISCIFINAPKAGVLLSHSPFPLADIAILFNIFRINKLIVYWHSDVVSQKSLRMLLSPITHMVLKKADSIAVSNPVLIQNSPYLSKYKDKCSVVPIGFNPVPSAVNSIKDNGYFLFVGRHVAYKGIEVLIKATEHSVVDLVLVGNGPLLRKHQQLAERLGLSNQVTFIKKASDLEVQLMMSKCRALVLPSVLESEAFGMVQVEAMSFGKPIINTNLKTGVPWVARNDIEAITIEPGDVKALTKALNQLNTNLKLRTRLGANAARRWKSEFTISRMIENFESCLDVKV